MVSVETLIERLVDAYGFEEFLQILLDDDRMVKKVYLLFDDLWEDDEAGD